MTVRTRANAGRAARETIDEVPVLVRIRTGVKRKPPFRKPVILPGEKHELAALGPEVAVVSLGHVEV